MTLYTEDPSPSTLEIVLCVLAIVFVSAASIASFVYLAKIGNHLPKEQDINADLFRSYKDYKTAVTITTVTIFFFAIGIIFLSVCYLGNFGVFGIEDRPCPAYTHSEGSLKQ